MADSAHPSAHPAHRGRRTPLASRLGISRRTVVVALALFWILDAALQFQPKMFTQQFVDDVLRPAADSQPQWLSAAVTHMANFVSHEVAMWNTLFALTQLGIGLGLLFRRTVKAALTVSFIWVAFVWVFGEGMGQIFTGSATPLMGAPGAVLLYGVIGLLVWPAPEGQEKQRSAGLHSSAAADGPIGARGALMAWTALWAGFAVLLLFPDNRRPNGLHDMISGMSAGQPGWYAHILSGMGHAFVGAGGWVAVLLAVACLATALGPLFARDPEPFLLAGAVLGLLFWISGQALGGILTGIGTDPNSGPLLVLFAAALLPAVPAPASVPAPALRAFSRRPRWVMGSLAGLTLLPLAVAAVPITAAAVPATATAAAVSAAGPPPATSNDPKPGSAMKGMKMSGSSSSSSAAGSASASGPSMAGMGGTGATDPNWKYTGPPLPKTEVAVLTASSSIQDQGHAMQTPDCTTAPTAQQTLGATEYVQAVSSAVAKYKVLSAAKAAGYIPITPVNYPVVHYLNPAYLSNKYVMDPNHVDSLVYATTPHGPVLVAAMFLLPSRENGPMPYGCLVQWHAHTNLCISKVTHAVVGFTPCSAGEVNIRTSYMTHVWQVPVSGGPLAIDPSDLEVVEAAIEAQQSGLAPMTSPTGAVTYKDVPAPVGAF